MISKICKETSKILEISCDAIYSKTSKEDVVLARKIVAYIACNDYLYSRLRVGRALNKDQSTTSHYVKWVQKNIDNGDFKITTLVLSVRRGVQLSQLAIKGCSGIGCPLKNECCRYVLSDRDKKSSVKPSFDRENQECKNFYPL